MPDDSLDEWEDEVDPVEFRRRLPLVERTESRGLFEFEIPTIGGTAKAKWPATNRSAMCVLITLICALAFVGGLGLSVTVYLIVTGDPENVSRLTEVLRFGEKDEEDRRPERVPVQTEDGIEIIEVCPPCDDCPECPACPVQMPCPTVAPPSPPPTPPAEP